MRSLLATIICLWYALLAPAQKVSAPAPSHPAEASRTLSSFPEGLLFYEGFDNAATPALPQGWTTFSIGPVAFVTGTGGTEASQANAHGFWPVPLHGLFAMTNDDVCNCDKSADVLTSQTFDLSGKHFVQLGFSAFQNGSSGQQAFVQVRLQNQPWVTILTLPSSALWTDHRVEIPGTHLSQGFQFRFRYDDNGNYASGLAIDDIYLAEVPSGEFYMDEFYMVDGTEPASGYAYHYLPLSQARFAAFRFGADVVNESSAQKNARLKVEVDGPLSYYETTASWDVLGMGDTNLFFPRRKTFSPYKTGTYDLQATVLTDSMDTEPADNEVFTSFTVHDSLYQRVNATLDGTGIWILNTNDRIGVVYNIFTRDTVEAIKLHIHTSSASGSRFRVKIFDFDTLTASIYSSSPIVLQQEDLGSEMRIPIKKELGRGKYLFVVEKETGTIVLSSTTIEKAPEGIVLAQNSGQNWRHFPYYPMLHLVMPAIDTDCPGHLQATITHQACPGDNDGSISVDAHDVQSPYTFSWSNGAGNVNSQSNLLPGTYQVTLNDDSGCTYQRSYRIWPADTLHINPQVGPDSCSQGTGSIVLNLAGGSRPLAIAWEGNLGSDRISGLSAGDYNVYIVDQNGCSLDSAIHVEGTAPLNIAFTILRPGCNDSNGRIIPAVSGTPPFSYAWEHGPATDTLQAVAAGIYTLSVSDSIGCTLAATAMVNDSNAANIALADKENIACNGINDGSMSLAVTGGMVPYTYAWNTGDTTVQISGLGAGRYTVSVTDNNGCRSFFTEQLENEYPPLLYDLIEQGIDCAGYETGSLEAIVTGGAPPYSYQWSNGSQNASLSALATGTYNLSITDNNGCEDTVTAVITSRPAFFFQVDSIRQDTGGSPLPEAAIYITTVGGTPPYSFLWSNGSTREDLSNVDTGLFELTIRDQFGCTLEYSKVLTNDILSTPQAEKNEHEVRVFPVPALVNTPIIISSSTPLIRAEIHDAQGRLISTQTPENSTTTHIVTEMQQSGIYLLRIYLNEDLIVQRKVVVGN